MKRNENTLRVLKTPVTISLWVLLLGGFALVMAIVIAMSSTMTTERYVAREAVLTQQLYRASDTQSYRVGAMNATFDAWSKAVAFVIAVIAIGLAVGLSHGIALVRVHKHGNEHITWDNDEDKRRKR